MVDVQGLASSKQGLRHLTLMADLAERAHGNQVSTDWFYQNVGDTTSDEARLTGDLDSLQKQGWIWFERSIVGIDEVVLTQPGIDAAMEFSALRDSPRERVKVVRHRVLDWLYDSYLDDNSFPLIDQFFVSEQGSYFGSFFTESEVERACDWLFDEGLIAGTKASYGPIPRPNITTKGIRAVENGESTNLQLGTGGTIVNNNSIHIEGSHSLNVSAGSSHLSQSNTVTIKQIQKTTEFIESARSLVSMLGLPADQQELVAEIVDELEVEATSTAPNQSKMKELMGKVLEIAVTGTASGVVNALVTMGTGALTALG